jgi:hypothetical protein
VVESTSREHAAGARSRSGFRSWFRREAISIAELAVHTFAVVLGIMLALALDEQKKEHETAAAVANAMGAVHTELESNRTRLRTHHQHLVAMADLLRAEKTESVQSCADYKGWQGTHNPLLLDAAYQTAIATQAFSHVEFSRAQSVAAAYGLQRLSLEYLDKIVDFVLRGQKMSATGCAGLISEQANIEMEVDAVYAIALKASASR